MKQILQELNTGRTQLADVPVPHADAHHLVIRSRRSLISAGTERMLVDFGRGNLLQKARQQPEKVRQVIDKVRTDGLMPTIDAVRSKLEEPMPLGYCNVGDVVEVGDGVRDFKVGDRVASNGCHAEYVCVPANLCAAVPAGVADDQAAFTVAGAIALQGVRLAEPTLGECFSVVGLGLIGLLAVRLLRAHGCRVLGSDPDPDRRALAGRLGAETVDPASDFDSACTAFSRGRGLDGVILTLSSKSSEPIRAAAQACRKRGRIVLTGVTGLDIDRADFYEKELSFQVSCSYGPGRYDAAYERDGQDYPVGFVRWTEQRNFEAVLDMMADGRLDVEPLISHRYEFGNAPAAYDLLTSGAPSLGIVLTYPGAPEQAPTRTLELPVQAEAVRGAVSVSFAGAGNYAGRILIPAFREAGAALDTVVSRTGTAAERHGRQHGFRRASSDVAEALGGECDAVVIATQHDSHASLTCAALEAGKHVFVEKPLALCHADIDRIEEAMANHPQQRVMIGFNRRFSTLVRQSKALLAAEGGPFSAVFTVNAGAVPAEHWLQDPARGGGRIVGEACHFIDLLRHLSGTPIVTWHVNSVRRAGQVLDDHATITLTFECGSIGTVHYFANGHAAIPKERLEVFSDGKVLQLDNFRSLRGRGWSGFNRTRLWRQDKGQVECARAFVESIRSGGPAPIDPAEIIEVSRVAVDIAEAARSG